MQNKQSVTFEHLEALSEGWKKQIDSLALQITQSQNLTEQTRLLGQQEQLLECWRSLNTLMIRSEVQS